VIPARTAAAAIYKTATARFRVLRKAMIPTVLSTVQNRNIANIINQLWSK
jgi:hypothetical protein